jgi:catechol 2,3-dioxygenase-like lactoylglutathione lyase family enzyme
MESKSPPDMVGFVPTRDLARAIPFFRNVLDLEFVSRDEIAAVFVSNGQLLRVVAVGTFTPQPFTILGWRTSDLRSTVGRLSDKGLEFIRYPHFDQDDLGIWTAPSGAKVAWFNDRDGNVLSYSEYA